MSPRSIALWLLVTAVLLALPSVVYADTPTPVPSATPVVLSSGRTLVVDYTWTLGEAGNFLAVTALLLVDLATLVMGYLNRWTR